MKIVNMFKKEIIRFHILLIFLLGLSAGNLYSQTETDNSDDRLLSLVKNDTFSVSGLLQAFGRYSFEDTDFNGGRTFQIGNARIALSGVVDQNFNYQFQFNLANEPNLLDAFIGYTFSEQFRVRVGAQKPQIVADLLPNPGVTDFISRARLAGAMFKSREIGVNFFGDIDRFRYNLGIYNGTGISTNSDNRFFYTARFAYSPELESGDLSAGVNAAFGDNFNTTSGTGNIQLAGNRFIYGADMRFENDILILAAEILKGDLEVTNYAFGPEEQITGYYLTGGYKIDESTRVLARWDHLGYRERDFSSDQFILGVTHYVTDLISFKVNLISEFAEEIDNQTGLSGSFQFQF